MDRDSRIDAAGVQALADYAQLPLAEGRAALIAETLRAWVPDANALSLKMSAQRHQALVPATVFAHPDANETEG